MDSPSSGGTVPGLSVWACLGIILIDVVLLIMLPIVLIIAMTVSGQVLQNPLVVAVCIVFLMAFVAMWPIALLTTRASRRETAAGYTTSRIGIHSVPEIDPGTGVVIRGPGVASVGRDTRQAILRAARADT